jgi:hypothetical protein
MAAEELQTGRAGVLRSLIRFEDRYDGIVRRLMDTIDDDLDARDEPPTLQARDVVDLCARVQRREISANDLQKWARVVEGLSDIAVESPRLYPILTELATTAVTTDRFAEIQLILAA